MRVTLKWQTAQKVLLYNNNYVYCKSGNSDEKNFVIDKHYFSIDYWFQRVGK